MSHFGTGSAARRANADGGFVHGVGDDCERAIEGNDGLGVRLDRARGPKCVRGAGAFFPRDEVGHRHANLGFFGRESWRERFTETAPTGERCGRHLPDTFGSVAHGLGPERGGDVGGVLCEQRLEQNDSPRDLPSMRHGLCEEAGMSTKKGSEWVNETLHLVIFERGQMNRHMDEELGHRGVRSGFSNLHPALETVRDGPLGISTLRARQPAPIRNGEISRTEPIYGLIGKAPRVAERLQHGRLGRELGHGLLELRPCRSVQRGERAIEGIFEVGAPLVEQRRARLSDGFFLRSCALSERTVGRGSEGAQGLRGFSADVLVDMSEQLDREACHGLVLHGEREGQEAFGGGLRQRMHHGPLGGSAEHGDDARSGLRAAERVLAVATQGGNRLDGRLDERGLGAADEVAERRHESYRAPLEHGEPVVTMEPRNDLREGVRERPFVVRASESVRERLVASRSNQPMIGQRQVRGERDLHRTQQKCGASGLVERSGEHAERPVQVVEAGGAVRGHRSHHRSHVGRGVMLFVARMREASHEGEHSRTSEALDARSSSARSTGTKQHVGKLVPRQVAQETRDLALGIESGDLVFGRGHEQRLGELGQEVPERPATLPIARDPEDRDGEHERLTRR